MHQLIKSVITDCDNKLCSDSFLVKRSSEVDSILTERVGRGYCVRLAKKLSVDRTTIWRLFQRDRLPIVYHLAIAALLEIELSKSDVRF